MTPYYQSPSGDVTVYCGRWEDVVASGCVDVRELGLVHADGPYGVNERTERAKAGRAGALALHSRTVRARARRPGPVGEPQDFARIEGDDRPFEPAPLLALDRPLVLWGANHYSDKVPGSPSWILWDKREEQTPDDNADGELAWTNLGGPLRIFRHWWRGALRKTEKEDKHLHPTQKPIALSTYIFTRARLKPGDLVFVPFLGSGPDLPAALAMGLRVIACDVSEECCRVAVGARLGAVAPSIAQEPVGPLFGGPVR